MKFIEFYIIAHGDALPFPFPFPFPHCFSSFILPPLVFFLPLKLITRRQESRFARDPRLGGLVAGVVVWCLALFEDPVLDGDGGCSGGTNTITVAVADTTTRGVGGNDDAVDTLVRFERVSVSMFVCLPSFDGRAMGNGGKGYRDSNFGARVILGGRGGEHLQ